MAEADPQLKQVGVRELRANLSTLLREAQKGQRITIVSRGRVLAEIGPPAPVEQPAGKRVAGSLRGKIWIADDFDTWPEDIQATFDAPL